MREDIKRRIEQIRRGEVPEGYENKRCVGVFPVDWRLERLVKYVDKIVDGTHVTPKYVENGVPFFSVETVTSNDFENVKFITLDEHLQLSKRCKVEKGDILLTRIGTIGKTALVDWDEEGSIYVSLALIKISDQNLRSYFYEYSKSSLFLKEVLRKSLLLATPPKINMNDIEKVELVLPTSRAEQRKIAEILSTCDRVIDLKKKLIEEKKKVKKWLMQTLLTGMIRVKDIENGIPYEELKKRIEQIRNGQVPEGYKKTELGIISHDWEITGLEKICKLIIDKRGKTPKQDSSDGDIPGLSAHNVRMGKIDFTFPTTYYSEDVFNRWMKNEKIEKEDIIMTTEAPLGNIALVQETRKYILGQRVVALRLKDSVNSIFGKHLLMSNIFQRKLQELATGTTAKGLSKRNLKYLKIYIPDTETQKAVSSILSTADTEIDLLNKDLEQWELKKKSLLQLLLTGIVRTKA